jgi:hypothetical protein
MVSEAPTVGALLADIQAAIDAIRSHLLRGDLSDRTRYSSTPGSTTSSC